MIIEDVKGLFLWGKPPPGPKGRNHIWAQILDANGPRPTSRFFFSPVPSGHPSFLPHQRRRPFPPPPPPLLASPIQYPERVCRPPVRPLSSNLGGCSFGSNPTPPPFAAAAAAAILSAGWGSGSPCLPPPLEVRNAAPTNATPPCFHWGDCIDVLPPRVAAAVIAGAKSRPKRPRSAKQAAEMREENPHLSEHDDGVVLFFLHCVGLFI